MFSIRCTTCQARLKVRDESAVGLILPCPKCGSLVQIVRPSEDSSDVKTSPPLAPPIAATVAVALPVASTPAAPPTPPPADAIEPAVGLPESGEHVETAAAVSVAVPETGASQSHAATADATLSAEPAWRKWLVLAGSPVAGLLLMIGLMYVFFSPEVSPPPPQSPQTVAPTVTAKPVKTDNKTAPHAKTVSNAFEPRWLPGDTRVVLSLAPGDLAGQSGLERLTAALGPCWTAAIGPAMDGLSLELNRIGRVTLAATDTDAVTEPMAAASCSLIAIQLAPGVDAAAVAVKGRAGAEKFRGAAYRYMDRSAWAHPFVVLPESDMILTGPPHLLRELETRSLPQFTGRSISRLVSVMQPTSDLIFMLDVASDRRGRIARSAGRLLDVWPDGRQTWHDICAAPVGFGLSVKWTPGVRADVAVVCADKIAAAGLDSLLATFLPSAKTAVSWRIANLPKELKSGEIDRRWSDRYEVFLQYLLAAARSARRDVVDDDVAWIRTSWENDPVSVASAVIDAVGPAEADWRRAGLLRDRLQQENILDGLGDYGRANGVYPAGAVGGDLLPPETRLSWLATLLPYQEHRDWHRCLQFGYPWNSAENTPITTQTLDAVINPVLGPSKTEDGFPVTHYVGVAGVGRDAGRLSRSDPRAGVFGYSRSVRPQDIADGAANTMAILGVSGRLGPWSAGGRATVRGLEQRPYVNGPDGFGSGQPHGMLAGMADGSARFISKDVDPRVLEQMATIGGEASKTPLVNKDKPAAPPEAATAAAETTESMPSDVKDRLAERLLRVEFTETPLSDVVEFLENLTSLEIDFDAEALARLGVSTKVAVTLNLSDAAAADIMHAAISPRGLTCVFREGRLLITGGR